MVIDEQAIAVSPWPPEWAGDGKSLLLQAVLAKNRLNR